MYVLTLIKIRSIKKNSFTLLDQKRDNGNHRLGKLLN